MPGVCEIAMIDEERIRARVAVLQAELENFVRDANARILAYQTVIKELTDLVTPKTPPDGAAP